MQERVHCQNCQHSLPPRVANSEGDDLERGEAVLDDEHQERQFNA